MYRAREKTARNIAGKSTAGHKSCKRPWPIPSVTTGGIRLDNKRYSLAVHYRKAADYDETESGLTRLFAEAVPEAHVLPGEFVYNLIPPGAPDKGDALLELMKAAGSRTAVYVGDDWTDEDVFSLESPDILTIRIEEKNRKVTHVSIWKHKKISPDCSTFLSTKQKPPSFRKTRRATKGN